MSAESGSEYVIMLDDKLKDMPNDWPITYKSSSLSDVESQRQVNGVIEIRPRSEYDAELLVKDITFTETETGESFLGGIYEMTPK